MKDIQNLSSAESVLGILDSFSITKENGFKLIPGTAFENISEKITELIEAKISERQINETGFIKIDVNKSIILKHLGESEVKSIAARICGVTPAEIESDSRKQEVVCARWLVVYYFDKFSLMTRHCQGSMVGKDHATAFNICAKIDEWTGWRLMNKKKFERAINSVHNSVGIKKTFK